MRKYPLRLRGRLHLLRYHCMVLTLVALPSMHRARADSFYFDGNDDRAVVQADLLNSAPGTLELWFKISELPADEQYTLICNDLAAHWGHGIIIDGQGKVVVQRHNAWERSAPIVQLGVWHHVACVYTEGSFRLYLDGAEILQSTYTQLPPDSRPYFWIGGNPDDEDGHLHRFTKGLIDEVRVWEIARQPEEVAFWRNRSVPYDTPGLVGYWAFEERQGQTIFDTSVHSRHGYLGSDPAGSEHAGPHPERGERPHDRSPGIGGLHSRRDPLGLSLE